jgi:hypothetical protein
MKEICIEHYGNDGSPNCAAASAEPAAQSGEAPLQQLKAEIAALVNRLVSYSRSQEVDNEFWDIVERLRQLSAV